MRVTYLKLYKYKRFPLSSQEAFEHHFQKKLVMIVGPNGAGKSSLMGELSPLPPSKDDFHKGGYKEIRLDHKDQEYRLMADFTGTTPKYHFYVGEEDLNLSHNVTNQRELVFQHFGVAPIVQDLLTGAEIFTDMSIISRKKFFNTVTHLNIDAVINHYNKLKEQLKNQEFLFKNTTTLMLTEKQKLSDSTRIESLHQQKSQCRSMMEALLQFRSEIFQHAQTGDLSAAQQEWVKLRQVWQNVYRDGYLYLTSYPRVNLPSLREQALQQLATAQTHLQNHYRRIEELDQQIDSLQLLQQQDLEQIRHQRSLLEVEQTHITDSLQHFTLQEWQSNTLSVLGTLEHAVHDIAHTLSPNPDKLLSKDRYTALVKARAEMSDAYSQLLQQEIHNQQTIQELEQHQNLQCPNCQHAWLPQEVLSKLQHARDTHTALVERKKQLQFAVQELAPQIEAQETYLQMYSQFANLFTMTKANFRSFWRKVLDEEIHYQDPQKLAVMVRQLSMDVQGVERYHQIQEETKELDRKITLLCSVGSQSLQELQQQRVYVEEQIYQSQCTLNLTEHKLQDYQMAHQYYERLSALQDLLQTARSQIYDQRMRHTVKGLLQETDDELSKLKVQMIEIDKELTSHGMTEQMVQRYEAQLLQIQEHIKVLTCLTEELSPKNGLIAKSVSRFLNLIIQAVNTVIAGVWDYKMELKVINVEDSALDYKFKVVVEDRHEVDDIAHVSSGMKEIVNLAMKITLFKLQRLEAYPIYLDELGARLDEVHRRRIADIIFKMLNSPTYSQIFLVTHLDLAYADFKDTEVIDLHG